MNKTKSKEMIEEDQFPSRLTSKGKGRLDMVHTAAQSMDRRKLSTIHGVSRNPRQLGTVPETQGGPRQIQYRGQLMDQVMKIRNRQVQTRSIETQRMKFQNDSMYTTSDFMSCRVGHTIGESPRIGDMARTRYGSSNHDSCMLIEASS